MFPLEYSQSLGSSLQAILFDWAGTVIDHGSRAPVLAVMQAFESLDVPISVDEARGPMGRAKREHIEAILALPRVAVQWQARRGTAPDVAAVDLVYRRFLADQARILVEHAELIPGCLEAIAACRRRGLQIGSSTGYTAELMELLIPAAGRQGLRFDAVLCADDVPKGRPAPWMCWENLRRLGVYPAFRAAVVDDTPVGVEAARNAGMWAIGVTRTGNLVGLSREGFESLPATEQRERLLAAAAEFKAAGAHATVESVANLEPVLDAIDAALAEGRRP
ncbi:MAG TPA: phosphonoacetaldehyde hydrolase [Lacipirellulaceae bacterium]|nr:phosphonoacetaldehyde hydrolase [Lacipirellulaceae bacterium]